MAAKSEKRQREQKIRVRCTSDEFNAIAAKANDAGLTAPAYLRAAALGNAGPRARRRLPVDARILRQVLGELGRVGNNLNQIAHTLNVGEQASMPELRLALKEYRALREEIYTALGRPTTAPGGAGGTPAA